MSGSVSQMLKAMLEPAVQDWASQRGLVWKNPWDQRNMLEVLEDQQYERQLTDALRQSAEADRPSWERLMRGMATLSGQEWTPELAEHAQGLSGDLAGIAPYVMRWAPDVWDQLHGEQGSVASLTRAIADAHRHRPGFSPVEAHRRAQELHGLIYGAGDPQRHRGFSSRQMGEIYSEAARRGLIPHDGTPEEISRSLSGVAGPISALRDQFGRQGQEVPPAGLFAVYDRLDPHSDPSHALLEERIRAGDAIRQMGAETPFGVAAQQQGGVAGAGVSLPTMTAQDQLLRQQAAGSPIARMVGTTARIAQTTGFQPGSPGEQLWEQLQAGNVPDMGFTEWRAAMEQSGIPATTAAALWQQDVTNRRYLRPELVDAIRRNQYTAEIQPQLQQIQQTGAPPEVTRGLQDELASRMGYTDFRHLQYLHGPASRNARSMYQMAQQRAAQSQQWSPVGRAQPLARVTQTLQQATPETRVTDVLARGAGFVPQADLPALPGT